MKLSIIIPCLNQTKELFDCLESISKQSFLDFEIIVLDGGLGVNLNSISKSKSLQIKLVSEKDLGVYDAMNKGIDIANGDWLYFMGVDDAFYDFEVLEYLSTSFEIKDVKLILGKIVYNYKKQDSIFLKRNEGLILPIWSKKIWIRNTIHHQGVFYHKSNFLKNKFDIRYKILSDYDFNLKLWKQQVPILILDRIIAKCGTGGLSKKYNLNLYKEEILLKTLSSSIIFTPIFICLTLIKYVFKKML
ncbi:MAG: glycosyltransferase [Flaviramulus sp.]|nr:glycosyltransferase [Flaviramulus sp.]